MVKNLTDYGAFVDIGGVDGLVHISELSWTKRVAKAEDVLPAGEVVSVKIKEINLENHRISLSLRDAEGDPWKEAAQQFAVGSTVSGTVESRTPYGLFITLAPGITGLLPAGVLKNSKQGKQYSKLDKGDAVTLTVQNLDTSARRISLAPEGEQAAEPAEDKAWKQHASAASSNSGSGMNIMAQALQKALKNK